MQDDEDEETTMSSVFRPRVDPTQEIEAIFDELEGLLKNGEVTEALGGKGVNASLALTALDGLRAYLVGEKTKAAEDLATVAEEISARLRMSPAPPKATKNGIS